MVPTLLTPYCLALSLSPPRVPPIDSVQHQLLLLVRKKRHHFAIIRPDACRDGCWVCHELRRQATLVRQTVPHPHLQPRPRRADCITRFLSVHVISSATLQHWRDSGQFGRVADALISASVPVVVAMQPGLAFHYWRSTRRCQRHVYGQNHAWQYVDMIPPDDHHSKNNNTSTPLLFFVHGGAWGSSAPWMYRLMARFFVAAGYMVALPAYRVYPYGPTVADQVHDIGQALQYCCCRSSPQQHNIDKVVVMGHSSGAHIALLMLVDHAIRRGRQGYDKTDTNCALDKVSSYIGLSGPYHIAHHFDYEAARGVEELSPMKAACGPTMEQMLYNSPVERLQQAMASSDGMTAADSSFCSMPRMLLVHGAHDDTVPFTATAVAARGLRACNVHCQELYVPHLNHQGTVLQIVQGGATWQGVMQWLHDDTPNFSSLPTPLALQSKL